MIYILGGGTFNYISCHLALSAPSFGTTAKTLHSKIHNSKLILTKMADSNSNIVTNDDLEIQIKDILDDQNTTGIILNCAVCDFEAHYDGNIGDKHNERLSSKNEYEITLKPANKIIKNIKEIRPDIFTVGFKTTCDDDLETHKRKIYDSMLVNDLDIVFGNDVVNYTNTILKKNEEIVIYENRKQALDYLISMMDCVGK